MPKPQVNHSNRHPHHHPTTKGALLRIDSADDVEAAIKTILQDKKVSKASHPAICAWRIDDASAGYKDDGEQGAGKKLLQLLEQRYRAHKLVLHRYFGNWIWAWNTRVGMHFTSIHADMPHCQAVHQYTRGCDEMVRRETPGRSAIPSDLELCEGSAGQVGQTGHQRLLKTSMITVIILNKSIHSRNRDQTN